LAGSAQTPSVLVAEQTHQEVTAIGQNTGDHEIAGDEGAYYPPHLVVYGSLAGITSAVGTKGRRDRSGNRKTGF